MKRKIFDLLKNGKFKWNSKRMKTVLNSISFRMISAILATAVLLTSLIGTLVFADTTTDPVYNREINIYAYEALTSLEPGKQPKIEYYSTNNSGGIGSEGYNIRNAANIEDAIKGELVYKFNDSLKDLKIIHTGSANKETGELIYEYYGCAPTLFYVSKTGEDGSWEPLVSNRTLGEFSKSSYTPWYCLEVTDTASYEESDGIKYIKMVLEPGAGADKYKPTIRQIVYSDYSNEIPVNYEKAIDLATPVEVNGEGLWDDKYTPSEDGRGFNIMKPDEDVFSDKSFNAEGNVIFAVDGILTDFSFGAINGKNRPDDPVNGSMEFYVSDKKNGEWKKIDVTPRKVKATDLGHWDNSSFLNEQWGYYWEWYGSCDESDGYKFIKIVCKNGTELDTRYRQLISVRYNSVGTDENESVGAVDYAFSLDLNTPLSVGTNTIKNIDIANPKSISTTENGVTPELGIVRDNSEYYYYAEPVVGDPSFDAEKSTDLPIYKHTGDIAGLKDVVSYNFWSEETGARKGSFVFKSADGSPITNFVIDGYDQSHSWGGARKVNLYYSEDGVTWKGIWPNYEQNDCIIEDNRVVSGENAYNKRVNWKFTFEENQVAKYIKFDIDRVVETDKAPNAPGIRSISYNTSKGGYAYNAEPVVGDPSFDADKTTNLPIYKHTGDIAGLKDVVSYNFWSESTGAREGSFVFKSADGSPITKILLDGYDQTSSWGAGRNERLYYSTNGNEWTQFWLNWENSQQGAIIEDSGSANSWNRRVNWTRTFDESLGVKYIKYEIDWDVTSGANPTASNAPGIRSISYNTLSKAGGLGTEGYNIRNSADKNDIIEGELVYKSESPMKSVQFVTCGSDGLYNDYSNQPTEFYASATGEDGTWQKLTITKHSATNPSDLPGYSWVYRDIIDQYTFEENDIRYVKVKLRPSENTDQYKPTLKSIRYLTSAENTFWDNTKAYVQEGYNRGWNMMSKTAGDPIVYNNAEGEIVYMLKGALTDFSISAVNGINSANDPLNGSMEYFVSADGKNWQKLYSTPRGVKGTDIGLNDDRNHLHYLWGFYWEWAGSCNPENNYRYIKIKVKNGTTSDARYRQLMSIRYNADVPTKAFQWENELDIADDKDSYTIEAGSGVEFITPQPHHPEVSWTHETYNFHKGPYTAESTNANAVGGSLIFTSSNGKPITDWKFTGVIGTDSGYDGSFKFQASKTGVDGSWVDITYSMDRATLYNADWGNAYDYDYTGFLKAEDGYKYVKITAIPPKSLTGDYSHLVPGYYQFKYNTEGFYSGPIFPEEWLNTCVEDNYFMKDGYTYTFTAGSKISKIEFYFTENKSDRSEISVVTGNGVDIIPTSYRRMIKDNGDGTALYAYYNEFTENDNLLKFYIKLKNESNKLEYYNYELHSGNKDNPRRHYNDVEIDESIEDLDKKSILYNFASGSTSGLVEQEGCILGQMADENFRIGNFSFGLHGGTNSYTLLIEAKYMLDFKIRYAYHKAGTNLYSAFDCNEIHAYVLKELDGEETEIKLVRQQITQEDVGEDVDLSQIWADNWYLRPEDRSILENGEYQYVRIEVFKEENVSDWSALCDFRYWYDLKELETLPEFKKPDEGLKEVIDINDKSVFDIERGGLVYESYNITRAARRGLGVFNNITDDYYQLESYGSEGYLVYNFNGVKYIDIRGIRHSNASDNIWISVSYDGEEWEDIDGEFVELKMYDGWNRFACVLDDSVIPEGTNFIKINYPDTLESLGYLAISDVLIHYTDILLEIEDDYVEDTDNSADEEIENLDDTSDEITTQSKPKKKYRKYIIEGYEWWVYALFIGGGVIVAAGITLLIIFLVKRKKSLSLKS